MEDTDNNYKNYGNKKEKGAIILIKEINMKEK